MLNLKDMPASTLLNEWAYYDGDSPTQHLAEFINRLGYRKYTTKHRFGRAVTTHDVRRLLKGLLQDNSLYPVNRAPTPDDYRRLRIDIITQTDGVIQ